jgi:polyribonucleotide nucleotidyltransferase
MESIKLKLGEEEIFIEAKKVAKQADSSVLLRYGDNVLLITCVSRETEEKRDFLPLLVEYREQTYAAGKIPGGFFKREGKPRDREIIYGRAIDRAIRPHFPKNFIEDVEVIVYLLSYDMEQEGDLLGIIGASTALTISEVPFEGPIGAVRVGRIDNEFVINPKRSVLEKSDFNLLIAGKNGQIGMVEFQGKEVKEEIIVKAVEFAMPYIDEIIEAQNILKNKLNEGKKEGQRIILEKEIYDKISDYKNELEDALFIPEKGLREKILKEIEEKIIKNLNQIFPDKEKEISYALFEFERKIVREKIIKEKKRIDGRKEDEIRPISCEVGILPRTHGSALFTRGQTQALVVTTLGTKEDEQRLSELEPEERKRFMLHYNFPPFSVGEIKPLKGPSRREIGHGNLAEKAIEPLIPSEEEFPYTIRVVSDILESNGSSSMATVCGASLSLMDAGVPIRSHVAGISIGLVEENGEYVLLTDIIGAEDHFGDMDFKVAGTKKGVTSIQLDLKREGLPLDIFEKALEKAKNAREFIIDIMEKTIKQPRKELSKFAPKVTAFFIPKEKIGEVIGTGGRVIKKIIEKTNVKIDIDDETGKVTIYSSEYDNIEEAKKMIEEIVQEVEIGKIYFGKVIKILPYGVIVEIFPNKIGFVHISELSDKKIKNVQEVVKLHDEIMVKVLEVDEYGRLKLSRKQAIQEGFIGIDRKKSL